MSLLRRAFGTFARPLFSQLAGAGSLGILMYHRVLERPDPLQPGQLDRESFGRQMAILAEYFNPLRLDEAVQRLAAGTLPPRAVAVTFDDGYADNLHVALPILQRWSVPATVYVTSGFIGQGPMWNDVVVETVRHLGPGAREFSILGGARREVAGVESRVTLLGELLKAFKYLEPAARLAAVQAFAAEVGTPNLPRLMLTVEELRALHAQGVEIGAHTRSHPILASVSEGEAREEIAAGRAELEAWLGVRIGGFAYPNGRPQKDYRREHPRIARELGFDYAVSTAWGIARPDTDRFQLPRMAYVPCTTPRFLGRMARSYQMPAGRAELCAT